MAINDEQKMERKKKQLNKNTISLFTSQNFLILFFISGEKKLSWIFFFFFFLIFPPLLQPNLSFHIHFWQNVGFNKIFFFFF